MKALRRVTLVVLLALPAGGVLWAVSLGGSAVRSQPPAARPQPQPSTSPTPEVGPSPSGVTGAAPADGRRLTAWAQRVGGATGIPPRALRAYGNAATTVAAESPGCHLSWPTLAGIGLAESNHGRHGGAAVGEDGRAVPSIVGPQLDGTGGNRAIRDTDGGALDGDRVWDRAVGPMQFIPTTWRSWAVRANRDGARPDPQNIDDAALAAARYLCASGGDLSTADGWWRALWTYNNSTDYGRLVFANAQRYADTSLRA